VGTGDSKAKSKTPVNDVELSPPSGSPIGDDYVVTDVPKPNINLYSAREGQRNEE
jgi:hypothetical protein